ncbi:neuropilin and tolloid-like protein 2 isoform X3 [Apostichopus japonicus]|uniref:neuropilin and tolloid-like protein 2 isoform X3 n=1 Tax=Stichopus japonicus TaxID=307972 RepID=UPI003AB5F598
MIQKIHLNMKIKIADTIKCLVLFMLTSLCLCWQDSAVDDGPTHLFPEPNDYVIAGLCEESFGPNDKKGSFQSPDYPYEYYANEDCLFFFEAEEDEVIQITFEETFNVEEDDNCQFDQVEIHDGRYGFSPLLVRLCGTEPPDPVTSTTNFLWVGFFTDLDIEENGFKAYFKYIPNPRWSMTKPTVTEVDKSGNVGPEDCFFKLEDQFDGVITSAQLIQTLTFEGRFPANRVDCIWEINVPVNYKILIEFQYFALAYVNECAYNRVIVYDRYALEDKQLNDFCSTTAPAVMTKTNRGYVRFVSSKNIGRNEWQLIYTAYRDKPCNSTLSFECGQHICIDHELRCNGRPNCWNFPSDEENCHASPPLLQGRIDATLGVVMTIILMTTFLTIVLSCRHSWLRTKHKAIEARQRRTVERSAVQFLMDNNDGHDAAELSTMAPQNFQRFRYTEMRAHPSPTYAQPEASVSGISSRSRNSDAGSVPSQVNEYLEQLMDRRSSTGQNLSLFTWDTDERVPADGKSIPKTTNEWKMYV